MAPPETGGGGGRQQHEPGVGQMLKGIIRIAVFWYFVSKFFGPKQSPTQSSNQISNLFHKAEPLVRCFFASCHLFLHHVRICMRNKYSIQNACRFYCVIGGSFTPNGLDLYLCAPPVCSPESWFRFKSFLLADEITYRCIRVIKRSKCPYQPAVVLKQ